MTTRHTTTGVAGYVSNCIFHRLAFLLGCAFFHMPQTLQALCFLQKQVPLMGSMHFCSRVFFACVSGCLGWGGGGSWDGNVCWVG